MSNSADERDSARSIVPALGLSVAAERARRAKKSRDLTPLPPSLRAPRARTEGNSDDDDAIITSAPRPGRRGAKRGDVIGARYVVDGQIGRGGMGRVLQVRHQVLDKPFALKLIKAPIAANQRAREMFYREARLASRLSHQNICTIVDFGQDPVFGLFMVMELLEGKTLFHRVRDKGRLPPKVACDVMWQIADALHYIHQREIIHGDIKSENILLTRSPSRQRVVKLLDFGLARSGRPITTAGIEGTPEYLAPERIYGEPASTRSDIYALGVLFYEVLVGHRPYVGEVEDVFKMHCQAEIPRPSTKLDEPLDERADEIIARAMAKDPDDRHQDVAGFMFELRTFMSMLGMNVGRRRTGATGQHARRARTSPGDRRRQRLAVDIFENAPVPLAAVDAQTRVRAANRAFLEFLGVATDAVGIQLANSALADVYPELCADLDEARATREIVKRVIRLEGVGGVEVDVAVLLRPAGDGDSDIILALHPLRRGGSDGSPSRSPVS